MKVAFIGLPAPFLDEPAMNPPLGLLSIAAPISAMDCDMEMVDFALLKDENYFASDYLRHLPDADIYAISCMTPQYKWLEEVAAEAKRRNPDAYVVAGGPHPTHMAEQVLEDSRADYCVRGDGEWEFESAVQAYIDGTPKKGASPHGTIEEIDMLPFPYYNLTDLRRYKRTLKGEPAMHVLTSRDCPCRCKFCANERYRHRKLPAWYVKIHMNVLDGVHGYKSFVIYDDTFTLDHDRVRELCQFFSDNGYKWRCWSRANGVNREILSLMRDSGLQSITFGIESGDDAMLRRMQKGTTVAQNRKALLLCKELGVPVRCSLMYGCPGETPETVRNTVRFIDETQPDEWNLAVLTPVPGSAWWDSGEVQFDKEWLRREKYVPCNRFQDTGIGGNWIRIDSMQPREFDAWLLYFVKELEAACPRKTIQDTVQNISLEKKFAEE